MLEKIKNSYDVVEVKIVISLVMIFSIFYFFLDLNEKPDEENKTTYFNYNKVKNETLFQKIINKIYFSVSVITTLGFGDITPIHPISISLITVQSVIIFFLVANMIAT